MNNSPQKNTIHTLAKRVMSSGYIKFSLLFFIAAASYSLFAFRNIETPPGTDKSPNILIIMADDLDSKQLSCYGGRNLQTPNIDALAAEGLKFNNIFCSEAMCVPTRASVFTGLYPTRHGSFQNHKQAFDGVKSICHYLGARGYKVGLTGKNHSTTPRSVFPFDIVKGFEENCVSATDDYFLDSVRQYVSRKDKPFCLYIMSINPHAPWTEGDPKEFDPAKLILPANFVDTKLTRETFCKYLAEVRRLDNQVGDIMKMLKETGQDKNTIVIFLGEQGPQFPGGKWTNWDYGLKSSMIVRWNGVVKPNTQTNALVQYEDITPTLIEIAGGKPVDLLDGKSFLSVLKGEASTFREYGYGLHNNIPAGTAYPIRSIWNSEYKLIMNLSPEKEYYVSAMMNPNQKAGYWNTWLEKAQKSDEAKALTERVLHRPAIEFYNTAKDPFEFHNLASEAKYKATIEKLSGELKKWMIKQGDKGAAMDIDWPENRTKKKGRIKGPVNND